MRCFCFVLLARGALTANDSCALPLILDGVIHRFSFDANAEPTRTLADLIARLPTNLLGSGCGAENIGGACVGAAIAAEFVKQRAACSLGGDEAVGVGVETATPAAPPPSYDVTYNCSVPIELLGGNESRVPAFSVEHGASRSHKLAAATAFVTATLPSRGEGTLLGEGCASTECVAVRLVEGIERSLCARLLDARAIFVSVGEDCFVASEFVDWLVSTHSRIKKRTQAEMVGQALLDASFFIHVRASL